MRRPARASRVQAAWRALLLCVFLAVGPSAEAYEGAGLPEEPPAPAPAPKLTKPPSVRRFVQAEYPPEALAQGESAEVVLVIDIAADGSVTAAEITRSAGEAFDAAARAALLAFEFDPAEIDGQPAAVRLEFLYRFEPQRPPPPAEDAPATPAPVNLRGKLFERGSREPLAGAAVSVRQAGLETETDAEGVFELRGVPAGTQVLELSSSRHEKQTVAVVVREGEVAQVTAYLWRKLESGLQVTVRGERNRTEVSRHTLQREELTSVPGTFGDPLRVIENLPGMGRVPYLGGALLVRGAQPQDTGVQIDGVPIPLLYHFGGGPSVLNPTSIERIDFLPGAYGARYGRAIAGIVDVTTRPTSARRLRANADVDLFDAGFYVEGPVPGGKLGSWSLSARRSYIDALLPFALAGVEQSGQAAFIAAPRYWDYQGRWDVEHDGHRFDVLAYGSQDTLTLVQAGDAEMQGFSLNTLENFHRVRARWSTRTAGGWNLQLSPTFGSTLSHFNFNDLITANVRSTDLYLRGSAVKELGDWLRLEAGLDATRRWFDVRLKVPLPLNYRPFPGEHPDTPLSESVLKGPLGSGALYFEAAWSPFPRTRLVPGVRLELYDLARGLTPALEPRIALRQEVLEGTTAKIAWGLFHQAPQPVDVHTDFGNPQLSLLRSRQLAGGVEQRLAPGLSLDLQGFYNWRRGLVEGSNRLVERDGKQVVERLANTGRGASYGLEALLKQEVTERAYGWIAYTLSRSEQRDRRTGQYRPVAFDQTHILTLVGSYKLPGGWETGLRFRMTTGRPDTPMEGSYFDADTGGYRCLRGEADSIRGATFHQLDLRVEKRWVFQTWQLSSYVDVQNVYNAENPELMVWDYRCRVSAPVRGLPFLPTTGITGSF